MRLSFNKVIENQITENNEDIKKLTESIGAGRTKLGLAKQKAQVDNKFQLGQIDNQTKRQLKPLQENLIKIQNLIEKYTNDLENIAEINRGNLNEIKTIQDEIDKIVAKIDTEGPDNQVIRVASWFKNYFIIDYELENNKIDKEINNLETSKIFNTFFFWRFQTDRTEKEIDIINSQISKLNDQKLKNEQRIIQEREKGATKTVYSDIPQAALTFAFVSLLKSIAIFFCDLF